jgi:hypothetical protein
MFNELCARFFSSKLAQLLQPINCLTFRSPSQTLSDELSAALDLLVTHHRLVVVDADLELHIPKLMQNVKNTSSFTWSNEYMNLAEPFAMRSHTVNSISPSLPGISSGEPQLASHSSKHPSPMLTQRVVHI